MKLGLLAKKVGMTRIFREDGTIVPVTVLEMQPSVVTRVKKIDGDGYAALQLGYGTKRKKHVNKSQRVFFDKQKLAYAQVLYEARSEKPIEGIKEGDRLGVGNFAPGDMVDVAGISIGKGFQGVVKKYHFHGGRKSHGDTTGRRTGSIGASAFPSRVMRGMRGPGRMGGAQVTTQNLEVVDVDGNENILLIAGAVPGAKNGLVRITHSLKTGTDKELVVMPREEEKAAEHDKTTDDNAPDTVGNTDETVTPATEQKE